VNAKGKLVNLILCAILILSMVHVIPTSAESKATVDATSLNVRSEPTLSAKKIGSLKNGDTVTVLKTERGWANISYNGSKAWVSAEFLKMSGSSPSRSATEKSRSRF
jgi:N-acetylmuramoyl-L-alanine amidase